MKVRSCNGPVVRGGVCVVVVAGGGREGAAREGCIYMFASREF